MTAIYAIILFCILIFPHELGHFAVAKAVGVKVNEFALGMGPAIFKIQKGETLYALRMIPIGGYCAMEGENEESEDNRAFNNKPGWAKISVLVSGSAMNVIIALIVITIMMGTSGSPTTTIDKVSNNSPAYESGIQTGDKILEINENEIKNWDDISTYIKDANSKNITMALERNGEIIKLKVTPTKNTENQLVIGIKPEVTHNVFIAVESGFKYTWDMTKTMFISLKQLITGGISAKDLTGPVGIISLVSDTSKYGLWYFGYLTALISLNLAIINMLPLPALDGGRILFVIIRRVTGKMISDQTEGKVHLAGLVLLLSLMIYVTWNDISRIFLS